MKQAHKDLLLKDLCARLPYGVWIEEKRKKWWSRIKLWKR